MKTYQPGIDIEKKWYVVDAENKTLGRLATKIASVLRGKHKPTFSPSIDAGDFVVVINAEKVSVTGNKMRDKLYHEHSNYPDGLKTIYLEKLLAERPTAAVEKAVQGMLPSGPLGRDILKKLKVYAGGNHPHSAQNPQALKV